MPFEPHRLLEESLVYRDLGSKGWLDRNRDPWGVKFAAFLRKRKDEDGLSVMPEPCFCFALSIFQIARLETRRLGEIANPILNENLFVWQDSPEHACIRNLPFHDEHPQVAQDLATDLANIAETLAHEQFEEAERLWSAFRAEKENATAPEASEGHPPA